MSDNECGGQADSTSRRSKFWFALLLLSSFLRPVSNCYSWDLAIEGDLAINGLASSPAVDGSGVDPSLNPPINWSFDWGDVAAPDAVTVPGGVGIGTDTEINVVDVGGAAPAAAASTAHWHMRWTQLKRTISCSTRAPMNWL